VAAVLTGMGVDGAAGLLHLRQSGASTLAQDEDTCVVFGMPREAIRQGAAQEVVPLQHIGRRLEQLASNSVPTAVGAT
jgi:two-component system chemotaxis response regulator CheB